MDSDSDSSYSGYSVSDSSIESDVQRDDMLTESEVESMQSEPERMHSEESMQSQAESMASEAESVQSQSEIQNDENYSDAGAGDTNSSNDRNMSYDSEEGNIPNDEIGAEIELQVTQTPRLEVEAADSNPSETNDMHSEHEDNDSVLEETQTNGDYEPSYESDDMNSASETEREYVIETDVYPSIYNFQSSGSESSPSETERVGRYTVTMVHHPMRMITRAESRRNQERSIFGNPSVQISPLPSGLMGLLTNVREDGLQDTSQTSLTNTPSNLNNDSNRNSKKPLKRRCTLEECTICCDVMLKEHKLMVLRCSHSFHDECLGPWLRENQTCPNCRQEIR